jgi:hypothetical protein
LRTSSAGFLQNEQWTWIDPTCLFGSPMLVSRMELHTAMHSLQIHDRASVAKGWAFESGLPFFCKRSISEIYSNGRARQTASKHNYTLTPSPWSRSGSHIHNVQRKRRLRKLRLGVPVGAVPRRTAFPKDLLVAVGRVPGVVSASGRLADYARNSRKWPSRSSRIGDTEGASIQTAGGSDRDPDACSAGGCRHLGYRSA